MKKSQEEDHGRVKEYLNGMDWNGLADKKRQKIRKKRMQK